jgi:hypothetical protein
MPPMRRTKSTAEDASRRTAAAADEWEAKATKKWEAEAAEEWEHRQGRCRRGLEAGSKEENQYRWNKRQPRSNKKWS